MPTILTIFGVTGDLTAKKIIPSLWHLFLRGLLPDRLSVIGFARRPLSGAEFEKLVRDAVAKHSGSEIKEEEFSRFFSFFSYHIGSFEDEKAFQSLDGRASEIEHSWGASANKLFYFATPPSSFEPILKKPCGGKTQSACRAEQGAH